MKQILLIEDDYVDIMSVKRELAKLKVEFDLLVAHNGVDALSILNDDSKGKKIIPDVILLDINMPKMNGMEFLSIIKNYSALKNIQVFITTTSSEEYDRNTAEKHGISGYILKPLDFSETAAKKNNDVMKLKNVLMETAA